MTNIISKTATKPKIWAICNYPAGSGGANAFNGVARIFAARTGLELNPIDAHQVIIDFWASVEAVLAHLPQSLRPEPAPVHPHSRSLLQRALQEVASELFFKTQVKTHGQPQALLMSLNRGFIATHQTNQAGYIPLQIPSQMFVADGLDITGWGNHLPWQFDKLVPHSHTVESLASEAAHFQQALKGDGKPLIGIVLSDDDVSGKHIRALGVIATQMPDARFVISSSPRAGKELFAQICDQFKALLSPEQQKHLLVYDFHSGDKNSNPYKALLTLADHMIIIGQSGSMVSDRLFAGRTVYYGYGYDAGATERIYGAELARSGKIKYFPNQDPLNSVQFAPIDSTRMIVDSIVSQYETKKVVEPAEPWPELEMLKNRMRRSLPASLVS
jgi:Mitochondrial fission ELM1